MSQRKERTCSFSTTITAQSSNMDCNDRGSKYGRKCGSITVPKLVNIDHLSRQIRNRYLNRLGIFKEEIIPSPRSSNVQAQSFRPLPFAYQDSLNDNATYCNSHHSTSPPSVMDFHGPASKPNKSTVSFNDCVDVRLIPHKDMFSKRIRKYLWNDPEELARNSQRNAIEFAAENWDWRQALEDDQFFRCPETGDMIHRAHVHWLDYVMAARQHPFAQHSRQSAHRLDDDGL